MTSFPMAHQSVAWLMLFLVFAGIVFTAVVVVKYYAHPTESRLLTNIVTVMAVCTTMMCLLLIPVDIYCVSSSTDSETGGALISQPELQHRQTIIRGLYYTLFSLLLVLAFAAIPFSYFFFEEEDEELSVANRAFSALKYTVLFLTILLILLVAGLIIGKRPTMDKQWMISILESQERGDGALVFIVSVQVMIGVPMFLFYTAYGLAFFPISLLRDSDRVAMQKKGQSLSDELAINRERAREIQSRYLLTGKKMSKADRILLERLQREERLLARRTDQQDQERGGVWAVIWVVTSPLRAVFGIIFLVLTSIVGISMFICVLDKAVNSDIASGFIVDKSHWFNPFDRALILLHRLFPLDYVVLTSVAMYVFFVSLFSIFRVGIRFLCFKLYSIRPRGTHPQGLLLASVILMYTTLVMCMELVSIAPQYSTFGTQTVNVAGQVKQCNVQLTTADADDALDGQHCTMTQISTFINSIQVNSHVFATAFYASTWAFIASLVFWVVVAMLRPHMFDEDDDDRIGAGGLVTGTPVKRYGATSDSDPERAGLLSAGLGGSGPGGYQVDN